jgi:hypothetical protein
MKLDNKISPLVLNNLLKNKEFEKLYNQTKIVVSSKWSKHLVSSENILAAFVSGSSVAANILSIKNNKNYTYNDIDVFIIKKVEPSTMLLHKNAKKNGQYEEYEKFMLKSQTKENGVNLIEYWTSESELQNPILELISEFDLNYAHCAIDISNNNFIYNQHFEYFIKNETIEIINIQSHFAKNLIRALAKKDEWNLMFFENEFLELSSLYYSLYSKNVRFSLEMNLVYYDKNKQNNILSEELFNKFSNYLAFFSSLFLVKYSKDKLVIHLDDFLYKKYDNKNELSILKDKTKEITLKDETGNEFQFTNKMANKFIAYFIKYINGNVANVKISYKNFLEFSKKFNISSKFLKYKIIKMIESHILDLVDFKILLNDTFWKDDFHYGANQIKKISEYLQQHPNLNKMNKLLVEIANFNAKDLIDFNYRLQRNNDLSLIGFLENISEKDVVSNIKLFKNNDFKLIFDYYIKQNPELTKPLQDILDLSKFKFDSKIKQLVSQLDLKNEGKVMNHCVSGYSNALKKGEHVFHLQHGSFSSTLHIIFINNKKQYIISQHRSSFNKNPNFRLHYVANSLIRYLNWSYGIKLIKDKYLIKVKLFIEENKDGFHISKIKQNDIEMINYLILSYVVIEKTKNYFIIDYEAYKKYLL